jgi:hypothetical protein
MRKTMSMGEVRGVERDGAARERRGGETAMHLVRRAEPERAMAMLVVVPIEEATRVASSVGCTPEAVRKAGAVLECLEGRFREGVVVGDVRPRVGFGNAQIGKQEREGLARHRAPSVRVESELARREALTIARLGHEFLGE